MVRKRRRIREGERERDICGGDRDVRANNTVSAYFYFYLPASMSLITSRMDTHASCSIIVFSIDSSRLFYVSHCVFCIHVIVFFINYLVIKTNSKLLIGPTFYMEVITCFVFTLLYFLLIIESFKQIQNVNLPPRLH